MDPIEVWEPRWKDRMVLVATHKLPKTGPAIIRITKSSVAGLYEADRRLFIFTEPEEHTSKRGAKYKLTPIPLDELVKINEKGEEIEP